MIDWQRTSRVLSDVLGGSPGVERQLDSELARAPHFQNRAHPVALSPLVLEHGAAEEVTRKAERYVALLEKVVKLYRTRSEVRQYFALPPSAEDLVLAEPAPPREVVVCRLDGYLDALDERWTVLENNADSPAGTLFTGRLNRLVRSVAASFSPTLSETAGAALDSERAFLSVLVSCYRARQGLASEPVLAILQIAGQANLESREMVEAFSGAGVEPLLVDPREIELSAEGAAVRGQRLDLCWNKINTVYWDDFVRAEPGVAKRFRAALERGSFVHVNSFGARYVAENKLSIPFLQDERFAALFAPEERAFAGALLPWARKLEPEAIVEFDGRRWPLRELVRSCQNAFVLKQAFDIRGDGVTIGRSVAAEEWAKRVEEAFELGGSVQAYVRPCNAPIAVYDERLSVRSVNVSLDAFVFNGRFAGFGSKGSVKDKVNLFQGGSKVSVVVAPRREASS